MKKFIIKLIAKLLELRTKWRANLWHFKRAVRKAEKLSQGHRGRRTYVYFLGGKYHTFNRKDIQALKNAGVFKRNMNVANMSRICLYDTFTKENTHPQFKNVKL